MRTRLGAFAAAATLVTTALAGSALADPTDVPEPGARAATIAQDAMAEQAKAALAEVAAIFGDTPPGSGEVPVAPRTTSGAAHGREATMALRDLHFAKHALSGAARATAEAYLSRPTNGESDGVAEAPTYGAANSRRSCATNVCVHWATSGPHAPALADGNGNSVPDYVDLARKTLQSVHSKYRAAGYRGPKSDLSSTEDGGNGKTDTYLGDIGDFGLYGYCTSDDPNFNTWDISAYCVLDEDYDEFPGHTPKQNLQVTAAHEYKHAIQYAYDAGEDRWFMEADATWAEDELYDSVNDNLGYLSAGQIAQPGLPLDYFQSGGDFHYGNWIFLRYLTERFPAEVGVMPVIMKKLWDKVDAATNAAPDMYAIQAIKKELAARNTSFTKTYAKFADATRRQTSFLEGAANDYPMKPFTDLGSLSSGDLSTGASTVLDHMTSATYRVTPEAGLTDEGWALDVALNLPDRMKGSAAIVTTYPQSGSALVEVATLNEVGNGTVTVPFDIGNVKWVEITLVNASTRFQCFVPPFDSPYSCYGNPQDDNLTAGFTATAVLT